MSLKAHKRKRKHLRFFIMVAILVALFFLVELLFPAHASSPPTTTMWVIVGEGSTLNMRFKPSLNSSKEGRLFHGESVEVYEIRNGWASINYCGDNFYCSASYLSSEPPADPAAYYVASSGRVRVREIPNGKLVKWANPNDRFIVTAWQVVDDVRWAATKQGYIMAQYLKSCHE